MIAFTYPEHGIIALLVAATTIIMFFKYGKHYKISFDIYNGKQFKHPPLYISIAYYSGCVLMMLGLLLIGIAVMDPVRIVTDTKKINTNRLILYILDASPSMSASDIIPTRFAKAVELIENSVNSTNALYGLIAFGKDALLICPPTHQTDIFLERLNKVQPGICGDGTNIFSALKSALAQIAAANINDSTIVLLSDGEDYDSVSQLAVLFEPVRVKPTVYFAAIGKGGDVPVTYTDPFTKEETTGMYRSQFNEEKLKKAAESSSIVFFANPDRLEISREQEHAHQKTLETSMRTGINILPYALVMLVVGWFIVFGIIGGKL